MKAVNKGEVFASAVADWTKVLIIEDDDDVRLMLSTYLDSKGCDAAGVGAAIEGVSAALGMRPDRILMDLGLPDADGLSAVRALRSNAGFVGTPVLVVTAYDSMQFRPEAVEAGYMVKPVDPERLLETVRLLTGASGVKLGSGRAQRHLLFRRHCSRNSANCCAPRSRIDQPSRNSPPYLSRL